MRVAGLQCDLVWEDPEANFEHMAPRIQAAARSGADLVLLPEMFATGFSMDTDKVAEDPGGRSERFLLEQAAAHRCAVVGSVATRPDGGGRPRNLGVAALPDGSVHRYAKIHPFTFGGESRRYDAGDRTLTFELKGVRVSLTICYDLRFPELYARLAPHTDLFLVPANWPTPRRHHWTALLLARAIECQCYVLGVNRVGEGGRLVYPGDSVLLAPGGDSVSEITGAVEGEVTGEVDPSVVAEYRASFPVLPDRRPEVYRRIGDDG